ncbi:MAG: PEP-CTERM sorting domain-containing protein [Bryobacterales bacterium]|nr:PEP-CTERM sorting domain-containing protein [Bryobacterales bacterium]
MLNFALAASAVAAPVTIGLAGFSGSETVVTFNSIGDEELVDTQFAGLGVTFSGPVFGMTNSGDTGLYPSDGGGVIASNWRYSGPNLTPGALVVSFASTMQRVGFYHSGNQEDDFTVTFFLGNVETGSLLVAQTDSPAEFFGAQDTGGFDRIEITAPVNRNGFFAFDDLRFEGDAVPEPSTYALMAMGLCGLAWMRRTRR